MAHFFVKKLSEERVRGVVSLLDSVKTAEFDEFDKRLYRQKAFFFKLPVLLLKFASQNVGGGSGEWRIPTGFPPLRSPCTTFPRTLVETPRTLVETPRTLVETPRTLVETPRTLVEILLTLVEILLTLFSRRFALGARRTGRVQDLGSFFSKRRKFSGNPSRVAHHKFISLRRTIA